MPATSMESIEHGKHGTFYSILNKNAERLSHQTQAQQATIE